MFKNSKYSTCKIVEVISYISVLFWALMGSGLIFLFYPVNNFTSIFIILTGCWVMFSVWAGILTSVSDVLMSHFWNKW